MGYDVALICKNGHIINSSFRRSPEYNSDFCSRCGARTIHKCPNCGRDIKGDIIDDDFIYCSRYNVPSFCEYCGNPFPWTKSAIDNAAMLIREEESLSDDLKSSLVESLPDVISETPRTSLAIIRTKKCLASAGKFTAEGIRQFVIDFGCELAKKSLNL